VSITEAHADALVDKIVDAIAVRTKDATLEELRNLVRLESELAKARETIAKHEADAALLRNYIEQLKSVISQLAPQQQIHNHGLPLAPTGYTQTGYAPPALTIVPAPAPVGTVYGPAPTPNGAE